MTRKELIFNLLDGKKVDRIPTGFWLHFPAEMHHGDKAVQAHLDFMTQSNTDILKIMNENTFYNDCGPIRCSADLSNFRSFNKQDKIFLDQSQIIKRICEKNTEDYPVLATIHGLLTSAFHETGFSGKYLSTGYALSIFCREKPAAMKDALAKISESLMRLVDLSLESGADGIFYAALGGEAHFFTDEEYQEFVLPVEQELYRYIQSKTKFDVLHICKTGIDFSRYKTLNPSIVNWGIHANNFSLTQGSQLFPNSILLGGFQDRSGVLVDGTEEEIVAKTNTILEEVNGKPFIMGSDCTLPTQIDPKRIRTVVEATTKYRAK